MIVTKEITKQFLKTIIHAFIGFVVFPNWQPLSLPRCLPACLEYKTVPSLCCCYLRVVSGSLVWDGLRVVTAQQRSLSSQSSSAFRPVETGLRSGLSYCDLIIYLHLPPLHIRERFIEFGSTKVRTSGGSIRVQTSNEILFRSFGALWQILIITLSVASDDSLPLLLVPPKHCSLTC